MESIRTLYSLALVCTSSPRCSLEISAIVFPEDVWFETEDPAVPSERQKAAEVMRQLGSRYYPIFHPWRVHIRSCSDEISCWIGLEGCVAVEGARFLVLRMEDCLCEFLLLPCLLPFRFPYPIKRTPQLATLRFISAAIRSRTPPLLSGNSGSWWKGKWCLMLSCEACVYSPPYESISSLNITTPSTPTEDKIDLFKDDPLESVWLDHSIQTV
ncbi:hypothetical protein PILCRDRAFT_9572 [Piloderma croceum F 1598]|uniref:Uncharacterized protein n=1 Tax=Piloderma croceum (strain F 1598) TaxID=765440 RepID=A0A0C3B2D4_PILCF|nr:hypothetical protein PILCRDRAFT_9572 [Piloderma croceum F 1598]